MNNCKFTADNLIYFKLQRSKISKDAFTKMPHYSEYLFCKSSNKDSLAFNKLCFKKDSPSFQIIYLSLKCIVCKKEKL
mgnify:CR=1 FL=1